MPKRPKNLRRQLPHGAGSVRFRNGFWEARWGEDGKRPTQQFATEDAANDFLLARWRRKQRGGYVAPAEMTVADLVETYLEQKIAYNDWKTATINLNQRLAATHIIPTIGQLRLIEVDTPRVQAWVDTLARQLSPRTVQMVVALLSSAFRRMVKQGVLPTNPCSAAERPQVTKAEMVTWSIAQCQQVFAHLAGDPQWLAVYQLMLSTGMRPGELRALCWSDIDFERNMVRIRRTVTSSASGKVIVGPTTKGGKTRYVPLTAHPRAALIDWQAAHVLRSLRPDTDYVFPSRRGALMSRNVWWEKHHAIIRAAKVPYLSLHGLRHTSATLELEVGTPIKIVSERLGHKDPLMTQRIYLHVDVSLQRSAADAMDKRLFGSGG